MKTSTPDTAAQLRDTIAETVPVPFARGYVVGGAVGAGASYTVRLANDPVPSTVPWPTLNATALVDGDEVLLARVPGGFVILGKVTR